MVEVVLRRRSLYSSNLLCLLWLEPLWSQRLHSQQQQLKNCFLVFLAEARRRQVVAQPEALRLPLPLVLRILCGLLFLLLQSLRLAGSKETRKAVGKANRSGRPWWKGRHA